jgi:hypothetical protein
LDAITPVGAEVAPIQQTNPLQTYAGILGIQQQKTQLQQQQQNLETGRYQQQQQESAAQNQQEQMQERMQLQQAMQSGKDDQGNPLKDANGELIPGAMVSYARRALPLIGNQVAQSVLTTQTDKTNLSNAVEGLQSKYRTDIGGILSGFVGANPSPDQVHTALDEYARQNPDAAAAVHNTEVLVDHLGNTQDPNQKDQALSHLASVYQGQSATSPGLIDKGGSLQPVASNRFGLAPTPEGAPIQKTLSPQVVTPPGGVPGVMGGAAGNKPPTSGVSAGPPPTAQDWQNFGDYNASLNSRVQIATDAIPRIQMVEQALQATRSGAGSSVYAGIARRLQAIGAPQGVVDAVAGGNLADIQEAEKMLFQTTMTGLRQSMQGDPARVAEFQAAEKVFPSIGTDPRASQKVLQFMVDQGTRDYSEQQALTQSRREGTFNPATWQGDYQARLRANQVPGSPASQNPANASGTAEGAKSTSKSGKPIIYRNGHWEYQ